MGYLLGSDAETITFTAHGIDYEPEGRYHAVDLNAPHNVHAAELAYAVCGTAVRAWRDEAFDPQASSAHDECLAVVQRAAGD